ncbi:MAG: DUF805 domain-containing protein [Thiocapsa sp.]|jgi:uncharacterized membrane protein YhaH (DUF805 family)|nr:DUF805 domain-containing protein [Thiocapsa sp.]MCG6896101.1 DUF805 domain-containing protein [Thiocapsa sp.]MCG6986229.1 DUF805 domain-containing protein [Thiocapsa sp.]
MEPTDPDQPSRTDVIGREGVDMTGPFDPHGRFGRLSYIAWAVAVSFGVNLVQMALAFAFGVSAGEPIPDTPAAAVVTGISLVLGLAVMIATILFFIRRLHDIELSGWWALLMLVPLVNVVFGLYGILKPGTDGPNRFGPPRPTAGWEKLLGGIGAVLIGISIAAVLIVLVAALMNPQLMQTLQETMSAA